jgi:hypothetical protein
MAKKVAIRLYDGGREVGYYENAEIVSLGNILTFKTESRAGKKVTTITHNTSLKYDVEETITHSGLITV